MSVGRLVAIAAGFFALLVLVSGALGSAATASPVTAAQATTPSSSPSPSPSPSPSLAPAPSPGSPAPVAPAGDPARASQIALDRVGGGTVTKVERETELAPAVWEVEVVQGSTQQDVQVDDATGAVVLVQADNEGAEGSEPADNEVEGPEVGD